VAVNFSLASGLMLTGAALAAAALGLSGSLLLSYRGRRPFAAAIPASGFVIAPGTVKRLNNAPARKAAEQSASPPEAQEAFAARSKWRSRRTTSRISTVAGDANRGHLCCRN
jgi:hypothetical protein